MSDEKSSLNINSKMLKTALSMTQSAKTDKDFMEVEEMIFRGIGNDKSHPHQGITPFGYTQSIDAAIKLIPPNWAIVQITEVPEEHASSERREFFASLRCRNSSTYVSFKGATIPIAVTKAALKALIFNHNK